MGGFIGCEIRNSTLLGLLIIIRILKLTAIRKTSQVLWGTWGQYALSSML